MRKHILLKSSALLIMAIPLLAGCVDEPCLEVSVLDRHSKSTKEWFVNDTIDNPTFIDEHGFSQTLIVNSLNSYSYDNLIEDDCGNTFESFNFSILYNASISPINLSIDIRGSGFIDDGFYLKLEYTNIRSDIRKHTTYDFVTKTSRDNVASTKYLEQLVVKNKIYYDVLEFTFNNVETQTEVNSIYFAKGAGIIKFTNLSGNSYSIQ